jgi:hypothetical protein
MIKNLVFLCIVGALLNGCKYQALWMAGVRQPKIENKHTIHKFLKSIHQDTLDTYALDSNLFKAFSTQSFKPGWPPSFRPIQIRTYNSNGKIVMQWASCEGFLKDLKTFDSVPPKNINGIDTTLNLSDDLKQYFTLDGRHAGIRPMEGYDYYFVVYFAKYFPRMSKESFRQITSYITKHPELKIKTYKINVDFNEFWGSDIDFPIEFNGKGGT